MCGGRFADPGDCREQRNAAELLLWDGHQAMAARITHNPCFDHTNTAAVMQSRGIDFPHLNRQRLFKLLDFAVADRWGQRANHKYV